MLSTKMSIESNGDAKKSREKNDGNSTKKTDIENVTVTTLNDKSVDKNDVDKNDVDTSIAVVKRHDYLFKIILLGDTQVSML